MFKLQQRKRYYIIQQGEVPADAQLQFSKEENIGVWTNSNWILFVTQIVPFIDFRHWPRELFVQIAEAYGCLWCEEFFLHLLRQWIYLNIGSKGHRGLLKRTRHSFPAFCRAVKSKRLGVDGKQLFLEKFRYFPQSDVEKILIPVGTYSFAVRFKKRKHKALSYEEGRLRHVKKKHTRRWATRRWGYSSFYRRIGSYYHRVYDGRTVRRTDSPLHNIQLLRRRRIISQTKKVRYAHDGCSVGYSLCPVENCDKRVGDRVWSVAKGSQQCCICGDYSETVHLCEQHYDRFRLDENYKDAFVKIYCECHECWSSLQKHRISYTTADCKKSVCNKAWSKTVPKDIRPNDISDVERIWKPDGKYLSKHVNKKWLNRHVSSMTDSFERKEWQRKRKKKRRKQLKSKWRSKGLYLR